MQRVLDLGKQRGGNVLKTFEWHDLEIPRAACFPADICNVEYHLQSLTLAAPAANTLAAFCCSPSRRLVSQCSKGQPVADAAGVLQVQLHSCSPASFPAAPQTPQRPEAAQTPTISANTSTAAAARPGSSSSSDALTANNYGYGLLSVVAVLADGVPVPAADGSQGMTLVSTAAAAAATVVLALVCNCLVCRAFGVVLMIFALHPCVLWGLASLPLVVLCCFRRLNMCNTLNGRSTQQHTVAPARPVSPDC
jgi:hypothetical protein